MSSTIDALASPFASTIDARLAEGARRVPSVAGELTIEVNPADLLGVCQQLRDDPGLGFEQLIDVCGVDYLDYGRTEWRTFETTSTGFSRGVERRPHPVPPEDAHLSLKPERRFAVIYHLLSIKHNQRLRVRTFCADDEAPLVDSVIGIWASADWFEREAFDLFGILFRGHPDLRRLLTDYGFIGHPFRKDFPLIGNVEVRYDPDKRRVIYQPVSIEPRTLVPKVIREDHRYEPVLRQREVGARPDERQGSPLGQEGATPTGSEQKPRS